MIEKEVGTLTIKKYTDLDKRLEHDIKNLGLNSEPQERFEIAQSSFLFLNEDIIKPPGGGVIHVDIGGVLLNKSTRSNNKLVRVTK